MKNKLFNFLMSIVFTIVCILLAWVIIFQAKSPKELYASAKSVAKTVSIQIVDEQDVNDDELKSKTLEDLGYQLYSPYSQLTFSGLTYDKKTDSLITDNVTLFAQIDKKYCYGEFKRDEKANIYIYFDFVNLDCKNYTEDMDIGWIVYAYDRETGETFSPIIYETETHLIADIDIFGCSKIENVVIAFAPEQYDLSSDLIDVNKTKISLVYLPDILTP